MKHNLQIPNFVCCWTEEYFHKSAFDIPIKYPSKRVINFLSQFKGKKSVRLYRGINKYNRDNKLITSWTYNKKTAYNYIDKGGKVIEKEFIPERILLDTTILNKEQKVSFSYDYKIDDKEVLIIGS